MITKVQYTDQASRQAKLDANKDKFLIEEDHFTTGNFLIFDDTKPLDAQLADLRDNQQSIKDGMADMYIAIASMPGVVL